SAFGGLPAGYNVCTSIPASCFMRSMREHGPLIRLPTQVGTATHRPVDLARYSTVGLTAPFCLISSVMMSSTGSSRLAWSAGCQLGKAKMSWPDRACASAAMLSRFLFPIEVMESIEMSPFSLAAHSSHWVLEALLAPGTQWSQKPIESLPAAWAPRTYGIAMTAVEAAAKKRRRVILLL